MILLRDAWGLVVSFLYLQGYRAGLQKAKPPGYLSGDGLCIRLPLGKW